jgi:2,4-dienoyl-CoA reductase-like NADH-dependent reductase (Old Yellow Enzyme family)
VNDVNPSTQPPAGPSASPPPDPFAPVRLGPVELRNRFVKAATNEGMTRDGLVTEDLVEYHLAPVRGGVGLTTVAYCAVSSEGRTFRHQLHVRPEAVPGLRRLTDAVHAEGGAVALQLGHAGWFANPAATREPAVGPSRVFSPYGMGFPRAATESDLRRLRGDFARAARLSVDAGADVLELHLGHGYLLSQFLSPATNKRRDDYGGALQRRARFPREVVRAVRDEVGDAVAVTAKLNMDDGFRGGMTLDEGIQVAQWLDEDGTLDAMELTGGFTARSPMYLMRGDTPLKEMIANERNTARRWGMRLVGPMFVKDWDFEEGYFLPMARLVRAEVRTPLILLGGVNRFETVQRAMAEGFEFVAMARALLREPDLIRRWQSGDTSASPCSHCNQCVIEMERNGTRCVERPVPVA